MYQVNSTEKKGVAYFLSLRRSGLHDCIGINGLSINPAATTVPNGSNGFNDSGSTYDSSQPPQRDRLISTSAVASVSSTDAVACFFSGFNGCNGINGFVGCNDISGTKDAAASSASMDTTAFK